MPPRFQAEDVTPDTLETPWIRTSERLEFNKCPQSWEWAYVDRIKPATAAPALRFGTLIHAALEDYYPIGIKRGPHPAKTFERLYKEELETQMAMGFRDEDGTWHDALALGLDMMDNYVDAYGKDERWKVIATELAFHTPILDENGKLLATYVGVMDGVWQDRESGVRKDLFIVDHKTTRDDPTKKADALILDEQAGAYWSPGKEALYRMGILQPKQKLSGMIYNFLRKGTRDSRPTNEQGQALNKDGSVSKQQPSPLLHRERIYRGEHDGKMVRRRIVNQSRLMQEMRTGDRPVHKIPGTLHNPHCKWCSYRDICELHEVGADWKELRDATMTQWEPYTQHAIEEGDQV